jgi:hypothetical protein
MAFISQLFSTYEARTLLGLDEFVSDTCPYRCPTSTLMISLNYVIFPNYYQCRRVSIRIVSGVRAS